MTQCPSIVRTALIGFLTMALAIIGGAAPASAKTSTQVTLEVVNQSPAQGETLWFKGTVLTGQVPTAGRPVELQYRKAGSSDRWTTLARTETRTMASRDGYYSFKFRPDDQYQFRVYAPGGRSHADGASPTRTVRWVTATRTLEERIETMGQWRGEAKTAIKTAHVPGTGTIRYQGRSSALLVESPRGRTRTWIVQGDIRRLYMDLGHARGRLGPPLSDAVCTGPEGSCLQRFVNGIIYDNDSTRATVTYGNPGAMNQAIAAAMSQVGYAAPASNISKYNRWVGTNNAWCSIFLSWVGEASRTSGYLPKAGKFTDFLAAMNRNTPRGSSPRVGAIAIFDTHLYDGVTAPTHAGLVTGVSGSRIHTIEGNTSNPATGSGRGVYNKTRAASQPLYYYYPRW